MGDPVASLERSDPWKDGGPCTEHASTTQGGDGRRGGYTRYQLENLKSQSATMFPGYFNSILATVRET